MRGRLTVSSASMVAAPGDALERCCQCCASRVEEEQPGKERQHERVPGAGAPASGSQDAGCGGRRVCSATGLAAFSMGASSWRPGPSPASSSSAAVQPLRDLVAVELAGAQDNSVSPCWTVTVCACPGELVEIALLWAWVGERSPPPAGRGHRRRRGLRLDGGGGEERHEQQDERSCRSALAR